MTDAYWDDFDDEGEMICDEHGCYRVRTVAPVFEICKDGGEVVLIPAEVGAPRKSAEPIHIRMFTDYMCPWCPLAMATIDALSGRYPIELEHVGYEIHPETATEGEDIWLHHADAEDAVRRINLRGAKYGLELPKMQFMAHTHKALVVGEYAKSRGIHDEFVRAMWDTYLVECKNISLMPAIYDGAAKVGISQAEVDAACTNPAFEDSLAANMAEGARYGIYAVPTFIIEDRYLISGAVDEGVFEQVFAQL